MFQQLKPSSTRSERRVKLASLVLHAALLIWLLHAPEPRLINPNSVAYGQNGTSVTRLYWSSKNPDDSSHSSSDLATQRYRRERLGQKLAWKSPRNMAKLTAPQTPISKVEAEDRPATQTLSVLGHGAQAGPPYAIWAGGPFYGEEFPPALPVTTADPSVWPWQLPESPGNEVIEI